MRSTDIAPRLGVVLSVLIGTGCSAAAPPPPTTAVAPTSSVGTSEPVESEGEPTETTSAGPSLTAIEIPQPGRPFDAGTLLAAMRDSRRPGGVPDQIETDAIVATLVDAVWTFGGEPWTTMAAGGSCGPESCTLELAGSRIGIPGEDLWVFAVVPATGSVTVVTSELRSVPDTMLVRLDELTRTIARAGSLDGLLLTSVRWLPPPEVGRFVLSYRSGGEEGSCRVDLTLDAVAATILAESVANC